jgi:SHS family lactate transporter-like MFS transporter
MTTATPEQDRRRAFVAAFAGWLLDGYDFTILTLVLIEIQRDLSVGAAYAGALGTVTLFTRLIGGIAAGRAADRWGRKPVLMISILWFSLFAFLSGFSESYAMLLAFRALFGLGMGAEWTAGSALVLEHWPEHRRGFVTGVLQGAFSWGFVLAALVFHATYPLFELDSPWRWRVLLWSGLAPAVLVLWMRRGVPESPLWLASRGRLSPERGRASAFRRELAWRVARVMLVLGALMFSYQSMTYWYASLLRTVGRTPLAYLVALNAGGIIGAALWGALGTSRLGHRGAISLASGATVCALPLFLYGESAAGLWVGALLIGLTGAGIIGVAPAYVGGQFPTALRGIGSGVTYHTAAVLGAVAPSVLGLLQDMAWPLRGAMAVSIGAASLVAAVLVWSGPQRALHHSPRRQRSGS